MMRWTHGISLCIALPAVAAWTGAQQISPLQPPPPPVAPAAPAPVFDPYHAQKDIEVGEFYMKKGRYDAAIDRFMEATRYQSNLAKPWELLGEAWEKKQVLPKAADCYKKYLGLFPDAPDAKKVKKRIASLEEQLAPPDKVKKN